MSCQCIPNTVSLLRFSTPVRRSFLQPYYALFTLSFFSCCGIAQSSPPLPPFPILFCVVTSNTNFVSVRLCITAICIVIIRCRQTMPSRQINHPGGRQERKDFFLKKREQKTAGVKGRQEKTPPPPPTKNSRNFLSPSVLPDLCSPFIGEKSFSFAYISYISEGGGLYPLPPSLSFLPLVPHIPPFSPTTRSLSSTNSFLPLSSALFQL